MEYALNAYKYAIRIVMYVLLDMPSSPNNAPTTHSDLQEVHFNSSARSNICASNLYGFVALRIG